MHEKYHDYRYLTLILSFLNFCEVVLSEFIYLQNAYTRVPIYLFVLH